MMQWGASLLMQCSLPVAIACLKATITTDFRGDLSMISVTALVIHGDQHVSAPLELTGSAELISGCHLKVYEGAPHGLIYTHMEMLNADIIKFIHET
jgi:non-heme chloroperoxidase